jgi:hypothetical protein
MLLPLGRLVYVNRDHNFSPKNKKKKKKKKKQEDWKKIGDQIKFNDNTIDLSIHREKDGNFFSILTSDEASYNMLYI